MDTTYQDRLEIMTADSGMTDVYLLSVSGKHRIAHLGYWLTNPNGIDGDDGFGFAFHEDDETEHSERTEWQEDVHSTAARLVAEEMSR